MPGHLNRGQAFREQLRRPYAVLLPLRILFGLTFLYAGLDKLLDPSFLATTGRGSIGSQMAGWVHVSPLGVLIDLATPYAVPIGALIALAEMAIGLGALLGLAFRLAAFGGAALSVLFLLTASWAVRPFYLGNDLPYAIGWFTLLVAGHGGVLALDDVLNRHPSATHRSGARLSVPPASAPAFQPAIGSLPRRSVLKASALGALALTVAGVATLLEAALGGRTGLSTGPTPEPSPIAIGSPQPSAGPSASVAPTALPSPSSPPTPAQGKLLARIADLKVGEPVVFQDPFTSDPGVLLKLKDGRFVAYDAVCTHAACTVAYESASGYLVCPCHNAVFDPARDAKAIDGPTFQPLMAFPLVVDTLAGTVRLAAD